MYDERAFPSGKIPEGAYAQAWDYIQQMQQADAPPPAATPTPEPGSWLDSATSAFAYLWNRLSPWAAVADTPPSQWVQIGPAPFTVGDGTTRNAGVVGPLAVDPQGIIYAGTFGGGLWKSTDVGASWTPLMDAQPSLQVAAITIHPNNASVIFVGTGQDATLVDGNAPEKSVGILRSTNGGATWAQIGPTCTSDVVGDAPCIGGDLFCSRTDPNQCPGTAAAKSALSVGQISIDPNLTVWAASSKGLWSSANAADPNTPPSQIVWTRNASLPNRSDGPDQVNHIFLSSWNAQVVYASIRGNDDPSLSHNGWWKSTNGGITWTISRRLPNGLPSGDSQDVTRAAIAKGGTQGTDILYSITTNHDVFFGCVGKGPHNFISVLERTTDSGGSWFYVSQPPSGPECEGLRSVHVDPTPSILAVGAINLWRSIDAGASFSMVASGVHVDHNGLLFTSHDVLYDGNDGGIWRTTNFSSATPTPNWSNLNGDGLANIEFYRGAIDTLNYGASLGGTQDNGEIKGGTASLWSRLGFGDVFGSVIIDPTNSNVTYAAPTEGDGVSRSTDGGLNQWQIGDPAVNGLPYTGIADTSLTMDPSANGGNKILVVYSTAPATPTPGTPPGQKFYRTINADAANPADVRWTSISTGTPPAPGAIAIAAASMPPSNLIFAVSFADSGPGVWRTINAATWTFSANGLPNRTLVSVAIDTSQPCTGSACTLYVTASGFEPTPSATQTPAPSHVFRTVFSRADQDWTQAVWQNISGVVDTCAGGICPLTGAACVNGACLYYFPNVPANKIVIHPSNPAVVYVGTDLGIFQGCLGCRTSDNVNCNPSGPNFMCTSNGTVWKWDKFTNGFAQAALVTDLTVHPDSGVMRAWTFGRSAWEVQPFVPPNPDQRVDALPTPTPFNPSFNAVSVRAATGNSGQRYGIGWVDDRDGANNSHVYYRAFSYGANGQPTPRSVSDWRVDDTASQHSAQSVSLSGHPTVTNDLYPSWVT